MAVNIRMLKQLGTSRRIWAAPPPVLTLRLSTLKTFCNCKTYKAPKTLILPQCPIMIVWVLSIDPAILHDHAFPGGEQTQATQTITGIATCPDRCLMECSHSPNQDPPLQSRRQNAKGTAVPGRQSKINKVRVLGRDLKNGAGRSNKGRHCRSSVSFPTVRAQFSAFPSKAG
jgi:hypothetical protein